ncbi:MAG TPA: alpha/beta hydrolase [Burkholderiaceae bacterium]
MRRLLTACLLALAGMAQAQTTDDALRAVTTLERNHWIAPNQVYLTASGRELKLDVYRAGEATGERPVLLNFHGGGWVAGNKDSAALGVLPYLEMGFAVVNVEYRLGKYAGAPAAVEDTLCALQWVGANAKKFRFDLSRVVTSGRSAGGHLALATAMIPSDSPLTNQCAANEPEWAGPYTNAAPKVAAVINWYGITDVADMLAGTNIRSYAVAWFGATANRMDVAKLVSPIQYVKAGGPPVLTIHGDADKLVPYGHAVRLHAALDKAGVRNRLLTIKGGGHGGFPVDEHIAATFAARDFLRELKLLPAAK